jgi:hypothetical protein
MHRLQHVRVLMRPPLFLGHDADHDVLMSGEHEQRRRSHGKQHRLQQQKAEHTQARHCLLQFASYKKAP